MEPLNPGASLSRIQDYVAKMETERGLDNQNLPSQCLKLGEEVGELYRAVRKLQGQPQDPGINLEDAFRTKEARI
jgi:NTP pyrophosphatase (non-canonical NTP hydrolase)